MVSIEFMAVRKIPLKEHQPLATQKSSHVLSTDPDADETSRAFPEIRARVRSDRALHDLVGTVPIITSRILTFFFVTGHKSIRLIRARLLKT